ncbi:phytanoyl-CoA dioxygenase family protein [Chloroflexi bacterium TSY]|nr:phytanoyl-CoA dioxygenase family protein [Chloroflexi bacterium TSY]
MENNTFEQNLEQLKRDGFLLLPQVLDADTVAKWKEILYAMYDRGEYEISNGVGNVVFEKLLALQPELTKDLLAHPASAPFLRTVLGKQCQLRSLRAHVNPSDYTQEWHMDFYDYYYQDEKSEAESPVRALCMNTTFYLTDNGPERARLTFLKNYMHQPIPDEMVAHMGYTEDRTNPFQVWCDNQEHVNLYPKAGDAVVFYSHVPHQGAKLGPDPEGEIWANIVLHYQQNPMYPGIHFVSNPQFTLETLGYAGTFPFADG